MLNVLNYIVYYLTLDIHVNELFQPKSKIQTWSDFILVWT